MHFVAREFAAQDFGERIVGIVSGHGKLLI
jgi:hypothetical protein